MRSTAFDAWLDVYDRNGALIASNDDAGGGTDARVTIDPCYSGSNSNFIFDIYVHATSYNSGSTGPYTLEFSFDGPTSVRMNISGEPEPVEARGFLTTLADSSRTKPLGATRVRPPKH